MGFNQSYRSSASGAVNYVPEQHTVDGDTVAHWSFDGDLTEDVSSFDLLGDYVGVDIEPGVRYAHFEGATNVAYRAFESTIDPKVLGAFTFAFCVYLCNDDGTNIARHAQSNGFYPSLNMGTAATTRYLYNGWQDSGSGYTNIATTLAIPLRQWTWVACSYNGVDGGVHRVGNDSQAFSLGPPDGYGSNNGSWRFGDAFNGARSDAIIYSAILKDIECTTEQLNTMKGQTGL